MRRAIELPGRSGVALRAPSFRSVALEPPGRSGVALRAPSFRSVRVPLVAVVSLGAMAIAAGALADPAAKPGPSAPSAATAQPAPSAVEPPWLGVLIGDGRVGLRIDELIPEAPAHKAGLRPDDEIVQLEGRPTTSFPALKLELSRYRAGTIVVVRVWRAGELRDVPVTLEDKMSDSEILYHRLIGRSAYPFDLPRVAGDQGSLELSPGNVTVLLFFDPECPGCDELQRPLSRLVDKRGRDGLVVAAISGQRRSVLEAWVAANAPSFAVLYDAFRGVTAKYRVERAPALVVVNRDGEICHAGIGGQDNLEAAVFAAERALDSGRSPWGR